MRPVRTISREDINKEEFVKIIELLPDRLYDKVVVKLRSGKSLELHQVQLQKKKQQFYIINHYDKRWYIGSIGQGTQVLEAELY